VRRAKKTKKQYKHALIKFYPALVACGTRRGVINFHPRGRSSAGAHSSRGPGPVLADHPCSPIDVDDRILAGIWTQGLLSVRNASRIEAQGVAASESILACHSGAPPKQG